MTCYDETDRDDLLIEHLQDATIEFVYGDLDGTATAQTSPEYPPVRIGNSNNCKTTTSKYRIKLDLSQISIGTRGLYSERLAMNIVHEYVHVAYFEKKEHPCDMIGSHSHGDLIYQMAWDVYEDIFGIPAPEDRDYRNVERWNSTRPSCLRD